MPKKPAIDPFTDDDYIKIERMAALGMTMEQIAAIWDRGRRQFIRLSHNDERLKDAMLSGRAKAVMKVSKTAYDMAESGKVPAMTMFYLKCRGGWREVQKIEHSGKIDTGPDLTGLSNTELKALKNILSKTQKKNEDTDI